MYSRIKVITVTVTKNMNIAIFSVILLILLITLRLNFRTLLFLLELRLDYSSGNLLLSSFIISSMVSSAIFLVIVTGKNLLSLYLSSLFDMLMKIDICSGSGLFFSILVIILSFWVGIFHALSTFCF